MHSSVFVKAASLTNDLFLGILKVAPQDQKLYNKNSAVMEDNKNLQDYGLNATTAKAQSPAPVGLAVK
jgi:elongin-B